MTLCNGLLPQCSECQYAGIECFYSVSDHRSDGIIKELRKSYQGLRDILDALTNGSQAQSIDLVLRLRAAGNTDEPLWRHPVSFDAEDAPVHDQTFTLVDPNARLLTDRKNLATEVSVDTKLARSRQIPSPLRLPAARWTQVSDDNELMSYLLALFWTWDHMVTRIVHRGLFTEDMCTMDQSGRKSSDPTSNGVPWCSEFLVNAMLAVAALHAHGLPRFKDAQPRGRAFANEAWRIYQLDEQHLSFPLIQGVALLWTYEEHLGDRMRAATLLEDLYKLHDSIKIFQADRLHWALAGKKDQVRVEQAVSYIAWGFFHLDSKISLMHNRPMRIPRPRLPDSFPEDKLSSSGFDCISDLWHPYPSSIKPQLSYHVALFKSESTLSTVAQDILAYLGPSQVDPAKWFERSKSLYLQLVLLQSDMDPPLKMQKDLLPGATFLSISSEMFAIALLQPFVELCAFEFMPQQSALSLCFQHCGNIIWALWNYRASFGLRHEYWMLQACWLVALTILPHLTPESRQHETFRMACQLLDEIGSYLTLANMYLSTLRLETRRRGVQLPKDVDAYLASGVAKAGGIRVSNVKVFGEPELVDEQNNHEVSVEFKASIITVKALDEIDLVMTP
ncbi:hypothetical protein BGZ63DRAFT_401434 [Mariannaea sp. PMI_226]|nr:hypothetical protein BGZ63DRAFT_401434 [Mariannaea sp. PMI_226]